MLALLPCGVGQAGPPPEGRLVDLTGDLTADSAAIDSWAARHMSDLHLAWDSGSDGPALLGTIRAGTVIFTRNHATAAPSSKIFRAVDDRQLLDSADLGLGMAAGVDVALLTAIGQSNELELRFFGIDGWNTSQTASDPGGVWFQGFGVVAPAVVQAERLDYDSRLYNFEVNLRPRVVDGVLLLVGFRTLQLHEQFTASRVDPGPESIDIATRTNNFLYGFQVGLVPYFSGADSPLRLEGTLKAGVYGNHALQGTSSPLLAESVSAVQNRASFVGEIGVAVDYRFCQFLAARAGYELLWLYGVALAPDQGRSTDLLAPSATVNGSATSFYQGATVSLEFVF
jgi:hypothetical protein